MLTTAGEEDVSSPWSSLAFSSAVEEVTSASSTSLGEASATLGREAALSSLSSLTESGVRMEGNDERALFGTTPLASFFDAVDNLITDALYQFVQRYIGNIVTRAGKSLKTLN